MKCSVFNIGIEYRFYFDIIGIFGIDSTDKVSIIKKCFNWKHFLKMYFKIVYLGNIIQGCTYTCGIPLFMKLSPRIFPNTADTFENTEI